MENNGTKKTLPAEVVFAKGLSWELDSFSHCTCPSGRIMQSQCALQQCGYTTCNPLGAKLDKAGANRKCRFADDPPHHGITYRYRITYIYQSQRGTFSQTYKCTKRKFQNKRLGHWEPSEGLQGGLKCSWVRTCTMWNIRRKQYFYNESWQESSKRQLNRILFKTWALENAWNALHISASAPTLHVESKTPLFSTTFRRVQAHPEAGQSLENSGLQGTSGSPSIWGKTLGNHCAFEWWGRYLWLP